MVVSWFVPVLLQNTLTYVIAAKNVRSLTVLARNCGGETPPSHGYNLLTPETLGKTDPGGKRYRYRTIMFLYV